VCFGGILAKVILSLSDYFACDLCWLFIKFTLFYLCLLAIFTLASYKKAEVKQGEFDEELSKQKGRLSL
jgi:hypothetical protein